MLEDLKIWNSNKPFIASILNDKDGRMDGKAGRCMHHFYASRVSNENEGKATERGKK